MYTAGGSLSASFVAGYLGERIAWHWGFSAAGIGVSIGLIAYLYYQNKLLGDVAKKPVKQINSGRHLTKFSPVEWDRLNVIKDFDLLYIPGMTHYTSNHPCVVRKRWDYFVKHFLAEEPPENYSIQEPRTD